VSITDTEALRGVALLSRLEGIIPALETAHAVAWIEREADRWGPDEPILLSHRGTKTWPPSSQHELPL
jgi:tryptophan synthase beta chain